MPERKDAKKKPGPVPDRVKLDEPDWEEAIDKALKKERPPEGWPKHDKPTSKDA